PSSLQHLVREITHRRKSRAKYEANRIELPERLHLSEQQTCGSNKSRTDRYHKTDSALLRQKTPNQPTEAERPLQSGIAKQQLSAAPAEAGNQSGIVGRKSK